MRGYQVRGLDERKEIRSDRQYRDVRSFFEKLDDTLRDPDKLSIYYGVIALLILVLPYFWPFWLLTFYLVHAVYTRKTLTDHLPMRMPEVQKIRARKVLKVPVLGKMYLKYLETDWGDPKPGWRGYNKARGIFLVGNEKFTNKELYLSGNDMLTHMLIFGTTGAGKTETLLSLSWNSLAMGSGVIFVDPKGTAKLALQMFALSRYVGRDDDFLLINYSTGNKRIEPRSSERLSNTSNPFSSGAADFLSDILVSLAIPANEGSGNEVFKDGAIALIKSVMFGLVELRDMGKLNLSVRTIREWLNLEKCIELSQNQEISPFAREAIGDFLKKVPGFVPGKPASQQAQKTLEQFGYNQFYFRRALSMLTDTYGHVYGALMGEVDFRDVVFNRRIMVALLPSMEKAPAELAALGKVILAALRSAMALGLGSTFEGSKEAILDSLPSASKKPTLCIADEYGYVATEGFAVTAAQARGLGFSVIFAGQDYAGFKRGSETEAEQILANTKIKFVMALEDPQTTWQLIKELAGEGFSSVSDGVSVNMNKMPLSPDYLEERVQIQTRHRVELFDLKQQIEGDFHCFFKDTIVRGSMFHAGADAIINCGMVIPRMLEIDKPTKNQIKKDYSDFFAMITLSQKQEETDKFVEEEVDIIRNRWNSVVEEAKESKIIEKLFKEEPVTLAEIFSIEEDVLPSPVSISDHSDISGEIVSSEYIDKGEDDDEDLVSAGAEKIIEKVTRSYQEDVAEKGKLAEEYQKDAMSHDLPEKIIKNEQNRAKQAIDLLRDRLKRKIDNSKKD